MPTVPSISSITVLVLSLSACAPTYGAVRPAPVVPRSYDRISASELRGAATAYDALVQLAPLLTGWRATLLARGPLYLDDERLASAADLRTVPGGLVREIRFLDAAKATSQYHTGNPLGAIVVVTRTAR